MFRKAILLGKVNLMKKIYIYIISFCLAIFGCLIFGLCCKSTYADFNKESDPLDRFNVGLLSEEMCENQVMLMRETLAESNYIIAAKVLTDLKFLPGCTTQQIEIVKVFKGEELSSGEIIDIVISQEIFWDETTYESGIAWINMGFANRLKIGDTYLLFLDRKVETYNSNRLFIRSDDYQLMPVFSYGDVNIGWMRSENSDPDILECKYISAKQYDFFLSSKRSADMMKSLRKELVELYMIR